MNENLETMTVITSSYEGVYDAEPSQIERSSVEYPNLKHLTLSPSYLEISQVRVICPNLATLHLVLDNGGDPQYPGSEKGLPVSDIRSSLRYIIISGKNDHVDTALLIQCIVPITVHIPNLPLLTIRDMIGYWDINYGVARLPGDGRFRELRFENVTWCWIDEMDEMVLHGPTAPIELSPSWKALPRLCERADVVKVKTDGVERVMQPFEWQDDDDDDDAGI